MRGRPHFLAPQILIDAGADFLAKNNEGKTASDYYPEIIDDFHNKGLFTACTPMNLVVESLDPKDIQKTGLTEEAIINMAESRLRAARLFNPEERQYLYINVNISSTAFSGDIRFKRPLDFGYGLKGHASVWDRGVTGTHGSSGLYILNAVSKFIDEFLADYLRVNEAHCAK